MNKTTYFPGLLPGVTPPLAGVALSTLAALFPSLSHGESYFNPAFLSADTATVAETAVVTEEDHINLDLSILIPETTSRLKKLSREVLFF